MMLWTGRWRGRARRAASVRNWPAAIVAYRRFLAHHPRDAAAWVQLGHALKESGDVAGSIVAYATAAGVAPEQADPWFQLAHAQLLAGDRAAAVAALQRSLEVDPSFQPAIREMLGMGRRRSLPTTVQARLEVGAEGEPVYSTDRYAVWREHYQIPEPLATKETAIDVVVEHGDNVATTLASIAAQTIRCNTLIAGPATCPPVGTGGFRLRVTAGTELHRSAAEWLLAAIERTGADAAFCDYEEIDALGIGHPAFQPMFDPVWMTEPDLRPPVVLYRTSAGIRHDAADGKHWPESKRTAHLPLLLAARPRPTRSTEARHCPRSARTNAIQVVVQTRDKAEALQVSIDSLVECAHRPDLLDIVVVDNGSVEPATAALLHRWRTQGVARILSLAEPFNWSRANNLAVATGDAPLLLFLNNDTETLLSGWDSVMRDELTTLDSGVLGALLLYPDRTIQHAGVTFGMDGDGPVHEGVGQSPATEDLQARWTRSRSAAAVTGAWMALRRDSFVDLDGFDERLAVAFNDIDLCLRARKKRRPVVQRADLIAIHHESLTRGLRLDSAAHDRERSEYGLLAVKWGAALQHDPSYNPHWTRSGRPFDGLRYPGVKEILAWLDRSAEPYSWSIDYSTDA